MLLDAHSHILPSLDDGARTENESLRLVSALKSQGVEALITTPHFYAAKYGFEEYHSKAVKAFQKIRRATAPFPVFLGFEVKYFKGITDYPYLKQLTLGGSRYMLLELDWSGITEGSLNEIVEFEQKTGITPILAHIERYSFYDNYKGAVKLVENGNALAQLNVDSLLFGVNSGEARRLLSAKRYSLLGSDTHSLVGRPPNIGRIFKDMPDVAASDGFKKIEHFSDTLFAEMQNAAR